MHRSVGGSVVQAMQGVSFSCRITGLHCSDTSTAGNCLDRMAGWTGWLPPRLILSILLILSKQTQIARAQGLRQQTASTGWPDEQETLSSASRVSCQSCSSCRSSFNWLSATFETYASANFAWGRSSYAATRVVTSDAVADMASALSFDRRGNATTFSHAASSSGLL